MKPFQASTERRNQWNLTTQDIITLTEYWTPYQVTIGYGYVRNVGICLVTKNSGMMKQKVLGGTIANLTLAEKGNDVKVTLRFMFLGQYRKDKMMELREQLRNVLIDSQLGDTGFGMRDKQVEAILAIPEISQALNQRKATLSEVKGIIKQTRQGYKEEHQKGPAYDSITEMYVCDELLKAIEGLE